VEIGNVGAENVAVIVSERDNVLEQVDDGHGGCSVKELCKFMPTIASLDVSARATYVVMKTVTS
jgi:hypothetical protein